MGVFFSLLLISQYSFALTEDQNNIKAENYLSEHKLEFARIERPNGKCFIHYMNSGKCIKESLERLSELESYLNEYHDFKIKKLTAEIQEPNGNCNKKALDKVKCIQDAKDNLRELETKYGSYLKEAYSKQAEIIKKEGQFTKEFYKPESSFFLAECELSSQRETIYCPFGTYKRTSDSFDSDLRNNTKGEIEKTLPKKEFLKKQKATKK